MNATFVIYVFLPKAINPLKQIYCAFLMLLLEIFTILLSPLLLFQKSLDKEIQIAIHNRIDISDFAVCAVVFDHLIWMKHV